MFENLEKKKKIRKIHLRQKMKFSKWREIICKLRLKSIRHICKTFILFIHEKVRNILLSDPRNHTKRRGEHTYSK